MSEKTNNSISAMADRAQWAIVFFSAVIFVGFACSRVLISVGMAGVIIVSLLTYRQQALTKFIGTRQLLIISLFFFIVLASGIYSHDKANWLNWVRIKLPYLLLPLAFAPLKRFTEKQFVALLYAFALTFFISAIVVLGNYALHYNSVTDAMMRGSAIPMPYSHIRYTLMMAFSFFCLLYLFSRHKFLLTRNEKWLQIFLAAFAFLTLHVLSVRSALIALYLGMLYLAVYYVVSQRKILLGIALVGGLITMPFLAYQFVPSFHNKFEYMHYDLEQYGKGHIDENSDALRIVSMKTGIDVWQSNMVLGVGAGDLKAATDSVYQTKYPDIKPQVRRLPHNQFIWVLATTGIIGFVLFLVAFFYPVLAKTYYRHWLVTVFYLTLISSFFTEDTLEEQIGTGFYLIFLLIFLNYFKNE